MALTRKVADLFPEQGLGELVKPENVRVRKLTAKHSAAATAQAFTFEVPTDRLIHAILVSIGESTDASGEAVIGTLAVRAPARCYIAPIFITNQAKTSK